MRIQFSLSLRNFLISINVVVIFSLLFLFYFITTKLISDLENYTFNFFVSISNYLASRFKNYIQYQQFQALEIVVKQELENNKLEQSLMGAYFFDNQKK